MHPLDNVIWQALNTRQAPLARRNGSAAVFQTEISILGGLAEPTDQAYRSLASLLDAEERVGLFLESDPRARMGWKIVSSVPLLQMVCENTEPGKTCDEPAIEPLGEPDVPEMMALTELTKPGPFGRRTREMGDYFGIRVQGKLVAMAGERLRIPGHTEISAVCTHPDYLGQGYATALIGMLMVRIDQRGETAFLHVRPENKRAVELYERLGFKKRVLLRYAILQKDTTRQQLGDR